MEGPNILFGVSKNKTQEDNGQLTNGKRGSFLITFSLGNANATCNKRSNEPNQQNSPSSSSCPVMASMAQFCYILGPSNFRQKYSSFRSCFQNPIYRKNALSSINLTFHAKPPSVSSSIVCSAANKPSSSSEVSSSSKIRSEVLSPFRSVRMFFYLAFIASGALGGLIALTQLIAALNNPARSSEVPDILTSLGIDIGAASFFAFLYFRENTAKNAQLARLSREESLSNLKLRVDQNKNISVGSLRGIARIVVCAGPASFIIESFKFSEPFTESLLERGVLVVPFATDGNSPSLDFDDSEDMKEITSKRKRLWQLTPVYVSEWTEWLDEQKKLAGVSPESPVYLSLRLDGRVRGSGVGYPPWNAFVAQLPPVKGLWSGLLDGMDGRVL
ncbi:protein LOW PSII ACCUMULATION 1, chloroplastic isoform X1 [Durio zibethinus]|uniref:Protein LOW PSII ACCUMULATION 1, chloroplastic isoform X1 n=1 Tax=Durio zibethinus TaxID=66656 RepID=A0A6P6A0R3_DURZI|nr:protein LOW PSII ACCUMULATION 1, chloroplastic isoform X1 [Durio zibethinus]XP_022758574.1 protein LOW PSII ACCUMULATION 1, chloroplastic isoform X1 [Durio zibethinus]